jgi:hypothetical protein
MTVTRQMLFAAAALLASFSHAAADGTADGPPDVCLRWDDPGLRWDDASVRWDARLGCWTRATVHIEQDGGVTVPPTGKTDREK